MNNDPKRKRVSGTVIALPQMEQPGSVIEKIVNRDAEDAVIGAVLRDPSVYASISEFLQPSDFFKLINGYIWYTFDLITARGENIDPLTVSNELMILKQMPTDGDYRIANLAASAPDTNSAETYARIVRDAATLLRICTAAQEMILVVAERQKYRDIETVKDECNRLLFEATDQQSGAVKTGIAAIIGEFSDQVEEAITTGAKRGIPSGYSNLDAKLRGAVAGELTVVAGSEGMGKTTFMLNGVRNMAIRGYGIAVFTLEMSREEVARILISQESGIAKVALKALDLSRDQWSRFVAASGIVGNWKVHIIDEFPDLTPIQLRRRLRTLMVAQHQQIDAVIIDGLWLMEPTEKGMERPQAVFNITRDLIKVARDFNVPIYITHQYNGEAYQRKDKRPMMRDLAESAGVRRNAQVILGMYRDNYYGEGDGSSNTELHILKDRNGSGAQGQKIEFLFDVQRNLFLPLAEENYQ